MSWYEPCARTFSSGREWRYTARLRTFSHCIKRSAYLPNDSKQQFYSYGPELRGTKRYLTRLSSDRFLVYIKTMTTYRVHFLIVGF